MRLSPSVCPLEYSACGLRAPLVSGRFGNLGLAKNLRAHLTGNRPGPVVGLSLIESISGIIEVRSFDYRLPVFLGALSVIIGNRPKTRHR
jgi:hypothetical protein